MDVRQANQCLCEWRGGFASTAYDLVKTHFEQYEGDVDTCAAHAQWLLDTNLQSPFLWKDVEMGKNTKVSCYISFTLECELTLLVIIQPKGLFRSQFILQTLAYHLSLVQGLPEHLEVDDVPRSALALSVVAVSEQ